MARTPPPQTLVSEIERSPRAGDDIEAVRVERDRLLLLVREIARTHQDVAAALRLLGDRAEFWWVDELLPDHDVFSAQDADGA